MTCVIPFGELIPDASVRFTKIDGRYYMSIRDLIMVFCETDRKNACRIWNRVTDDRKAEVASFLHHLQFPGPGEKKQDVITLQGALKLIMWLPGNAAKDFRSKTTDILTRYLAGDCTLLKEIEANAASDHPVNNFARAAMEEPESSSDGELFRKRKKQREEAMEELQIKERMLALENGQLALENGQLALENGKLALENGKMKLENERKETSMKLEKERKENTVGFFKYSMEVLKEITGAPINAITVMQYEEHVKNCTFTGINEESSGGVWESSRFSISVLAAQMGFKCMDGQEIELAKIMARKYREKYAEEPIKHKQGKEGKVIFVNSYTERDREMAEEVIKEYMERAAQAPKQQKKKKPKQAAP